VAGHGVGSPPAQLANLAENSAGAMLDAILAWADHIDARLLMIRGFVRVVRAGETDWVSCRYVLLRFVISVEIFNSKSII